MDKKKVSVMVAGQRFNIITDEEEKYVIEVAAKVDARITSLAISQNMRRERAAVLTALDFADDNEKDKREMVEIREQIKDYLASIEELTEANAQLKAELSKNNLSAESLKDAQRLLAESDKEKESLKKQIAALKEQIEQAQKAAETIVNSKPAEEIPAEPEKPVIAEPEKEEKPAVSAEDDLFFDVPEEPVKPLPRKEKKNRHDHSHVNPYKQQFLQKQNEQKGYTQQRQYSLFDTDE